MKTLLTAVLFAAAWTVNPAAACPRNPCVAKPQPTAATITPCNTAGCAAEDRGAVTCTAAQVTADCSPANCLAVNRKPTDAMVATPALR